MDVSPTNDKECRKRKISGSEGALNSTRRARKQRKSEAPVYFSHPSDPINLLNIFPEEVWILVLEKVGNPQDLENLTKGAAFFRQNLESRKVEYLFPMVLPVLMKWYVANDPAAKSLDLSSDLENFNSSSSSDQERHQQDNEQNSDDDDEQELVEQEPSKKINKLDPAVLRLVCKCWESAVETYNVEHSSNFTIDPAVLKNLEFTKEDSDSDSDSCDSTPEFDKFDQFTWPRPMVKVFRVNNSIGSDYMTSFIKEFEQHSRNPLFHRSVLINDARTFAQMFATDTQELWDTFTLFLKKFGKHVWFLTINLKREIMGASYYLKVVEWLELVPNLKVLHWQYPLKWSDLEDDDDLDFSTHVPINLICKMEQLVQQNPLPILPHLKFFKADDLPYPIFQDFIQRNDHITQLQFHRKFPPPPQYEDHYKYNFHNGLVLNLHELSLILWNTDELKEVEASSSTWSFLKKLSIYWGSFESKFTGFNTWKLIFGVVENKCKGELKELTLGLPEYRIPIWKADPEDGMEGNNGNCLELKAPELKKLNLILPNPDTYIDFILPLNKTLEQLQVVMQENGQCRFSSRNIRGPQNIQFVGFHYRMWESNIWKLFPKLQKIRLKIRGRQGISSGWIQCAREDVPQGEGAN